MRFQAFENGKVAGKFKLRGAYLVGTDGIAVRKTQITFEKGLIDCKKPNAETAGLTLLWPVEGFGNVILPTTCLPDRVDLYNLNVEIARAKLMQIISKREEWSFFDGVMVREIPRLKRRICLFRLFKISPMRRWLRGWLTRQSKKPWFFRKSLLLNRLNRF